jgi:hypothetical protein
VPARLAKGGWMLACSQFPNCRGFIDPVQKEPAASHQASAALKVKNPDSPAMIRAREAEW